MKTLPAYVVREHIFPFLMGTTIFTFLLIMDKIFTLSDLIVKYGISVFIVGKLLLYILPSTFAITIPMACLVAVMVAFSRLKNDQEIMAMKASGISMLSLVFRILIMGAGLTVIMIWFNNTILPQANFAYRNLYFNIISQRAAIVIREHVFVEDFDGYVFRVGDKNPITGELRDVVVFVKGRAPDDPIRTLMAQQGRLITDDENRRVVLKLENGFMQIVPPDDPEAFSRIDFHTNFLDLDINRALADKNQNSGKSAREMSMAEIREQIRQQKKKGENVNWLRVEYHKKSSIPFACLAFLLLGAPLGILAPRSGRYFAYFSGVLLIFLYYILLSLGETLGSKGSIPPFWAMWFPNFLLIGTGLYGLAWVLKERPPFFARRPFKGKKY